MCGRCAIGIENGGLGGSFKWRKGGEAKKIQGAIVLRSGEKWEGKNGEKNGGPGLGKWGKREKSRRMGKKRGKRKRKEKNKIKKEEMEWCPVVLGMGGGMGGERK